MKRLIILIALFFSASASFALPFNQPNSAEIKKLRYAKIATNKGTMLFELFPQEATMHVANFKYLADNKVLNGINFSNFIDGQIISAGEPQGLIENKYNYSIPAEFNNHKHKFGTLGMARHPDAKNPERSSMGTQFHILLDTASHLDGLYTAFGQLTNGTSVLRSLKSGDRILEVVVYVEK